MTNSPSSAPLDQRVAQTPENVKRRESDPRDAILSVRSFYQGKNVFITGATGFLGKFLVEKLLFSTEVKSVYVLLRSKRGKTPQDRLNEFKADKIFSFRLNGDQLSKVQVVSGDISLPGLGLSDEDKLTLKSKVNIIFHSAASVRFDDPITQAVQMNVIATLEMLKLAETIHDLQSFVHVSTAFVNCHDSRLDEKPVECIYDPFEVMQNPQLIQNLHPYPNSYTLTKSLAEKLVDKYSANCNLPIAIARPAIVMGAVNEPLANYCDNFKQAPSALISIRVSGLLRVLPASGDKDAPIMPVDYCVNGMIAIGARCARDFRESQQSGLIYALVNSGSNRVTIEKGFNHECLEPLEHTHPFKMAIRRPANLDFEPNEWKFLVKSFFYDRIFALLFDLMLLITFQRTGVTKIMKKAVDQVYVFKFFMGKQYEMADERMRESFSQMDSKERKMFNCDCDCIDWPRYIGNYWPVLRQYAFHQTSEDDEEARRRIRKATMIMYGIYCCIGVLLLAVFLR